MSNSFAPIFYWDRHQQAEKVELVYGDSVLKWTYGTWLGQKLANQVLSRPICSQAYGLYQSSRWSHHKIKPFIEQFKISMEEYEEGPFRSFNDFFIRKFKPGARIFTQKESEFAAFSEARYFAFKENTPERHFPIKGASLSAADLLGDSKKATPFIGGPLLLARLCPTDYHRFHFPDSGKLLETYSIRGPLHSVNPLALQYNPKTLISNERQVSILETQNFGLLAYVEVGALCVGKIVQTYDPQKPFERGQEKGYFLFGGSTVIVLGQPGIWEPDPDITEQTNQNRETLIRLGERVGTKR